MAAMRHRGASFHAVAACRRMHAANRAGLDRLAAHFAPAVDVDEVARAQQHRERRVAAVVSSMSSSSGVAPVALDRHHLA